MMTSCASTPTTPRLAEPEKPAFPKLTPQELDQLKACTKDKPTCTVSRSIILKFDDKILLYRAYAKECMAVINKNNEKAGNN